MEGLRQAGCSCEEVRRAGYSCEEARRAGWDTLQELKQAGYVEGLAWVHDAGARMAVAFSPEGTREKELPL